MKIAQIISVISAGCLLILSNGQLSAQVIPTKEWVSFYSSNTLLNGELVAAGSIISAYDADGQLCGIDTVTVNGYYGFLQVYGDDPTTLNIDEGAEQGDSLYISINGYFTQSQIGVVPLWIGNGETIELDLEAWSNWPPVILDIPDQTILEGGEFESIHLDTYVSDADHPDQQLIWSFSGNQELSIQMTDNNLSVSCPDEDWFGTESVIFRVADPEGLYDEVTVKFTVTAVNDTPVVGNVENRTIFEGERFAAINLNDYVTDPDNTLQELTWTSTGSQSLTMTIESGILSVTIPNEDWFGAEAVTMQVADPSGASDSDTVLFTVIAVNDTPVVNDIEDQIIFEGDSFQVINLDDYVYDVEDSDDQMVWTLSGNQELIISVTNRIAEINVPSPDWTGSETISFTVSDREQVSVSEEATFTVKNINDGPVISRLPNLKFKEDGTLILSQTYWYPYIEDPDHADSLLTVLVESGLYVKVQQRDGSILFWANENWFGMDTLLFIVTDGEYADSSRLHINVYPVNDNPKINLPVRVEVEDDTTCQIELWEYVEDVDSHDSLLNYQFFVENDSVSWQYDKKSGQLTLVFDSDFVGSTEFFVTVIDDSGATAADSVVIKVIKTSTELSEPSPVKIPMQFRLGQNYPNPFNPGTIIRYELAEPVNVELSVFNMLGEKVVTLDSGNKPAGQHQVRWDAGHLAGGIYYYMLKAGKFRDVKKMIFLR